MGTVAWDRGTKAPSKYASSPGFTSPTILSLQTSDVLAHAAGHVDRRPGDVAGPRPGQEGHDAGHLLGLPETPQRDLPLGPLAEGLRLGQFGSPRRVDVLPLRGDHEADVHA